MVEPSKTQDIGDEFHHINHFLLYLLSTCIGTIFCNFSTIILGLVLVLQCILICKQINSINEQWKTYWTTQAWSANQILICSPHWKINNIWWICHCKIYIKFLRPPNSCCFLRCIIHSLHFKDCWSFVHMIPFFVITGCLLKGGHVDDKTISECWMIWIT